jgi:alginate O-acetyltransferase complex protein AlgI
LLSTASVFFAALLIQKTKSKKKKLLWLWLAVGLNLLILFVFKYLDFFFDSISEILSLAGISFSSPTLNLLLPVGISFYTFQAIGYLIDVFRGTKEIETHFGKFALYVSFFPQLVAGPIERANHLIPQLNNLNADFNYNRVMAGLKLIIWGFFKKVVVADNLGIFVNEIFNQTTEYGGFQFALAAILFGFQVYCDFSAYSDIAIGTARIMGVKLMLNFRLPYLAVSIADFWKRWHISLSTWLRDYLFLTVSWKISRAFKKQSYAHVRADYLIYFFAVLITFFLTGLWHGAKWTFVLWGLFHALLLLLEFFSRKKRRSIRTYLGISKKSLINRIFSVLITFCLLSVSWVFFRANSTQDAFYMLSKIFGHWNSFGLPVLDKGYYVLGGIFSLIIMIIVEVKMGDRSFEQLLMKQSRIFRWGFFYVIIALIFMLGYFGDVEFIYFQF